MRVNWRFSSEALYQMIQTEFNDTIDRLFERRNKQLLYVMYKIVNGNLPPHIVNLFSYRQYLNIPQPSTNFKKRSLAYRGPKIWNSLPNDVKQCVSLSAFKVAIDKSYSSLQFLLHFQGFYLFIYLFLYFYNWAYLISVTIVIIIFHLFC